MRYKHKFKDDFVLVLSGDVFNFKGTTYVIYGKIGLDVKNMRLQLRDDIWISPDGGQFLSFHKICELWDEMHPAILGLLSTKALFGYEYK